APALMAFNANLTSSEGFTFDVARNWALARALLTHPTIQVQWLFISNPLKEALLEHARAQQEPEQLLARAREVLWQPTDSSPHNDHFHLRVYCSQKERLEGCLNTGPTWSWIDTYDTAVEARIQALLKGLDDPEPTVRQEVINVMIRVHLPGAAVALAKRALFDPAPTVRLTALRALSLWRASDTEVIAALERAIRVPGGGTLGSDDDFEIALPADLPLGPHEAERDPERDRHRTAQVVERLYSTLATIASPKSLPLMRDAMGSTRRVGSDPDSAIPEAQLAAQATAHIMELGLVEPLIALLDHEDGATRQAAATTLRRITNHTFKTRWERGMSSKRLRKRQAKWRRWWRDQRGKNRDALLLAGFKEASRRLRKAKTLESWTVVDRLVRLTKRDDHVGYNADRLLCRLLGRWSPRDADAEDKHKRWSKWWRKNKKRLKDRWG
ncbi:MAG: HEAT repeat domain-containing protein, partial [Myxococcota bacterium]